MKMMMIILVSVYFLNIYIPADVINSKKKREKGLFHSIQHQLLLCDYGVLKKNKTKQSQKHLKWSNCFLLLLLLVVAFFPSALLRNSLRVVLACAWVRRAVRVERANLLEASRAEGEHLVAERHEQVVSWVEHLSGGVAWRKVQTTEVEPKGVLALLGDSRRAGKGLVPDRRGVVYLGPHVSSVVGGTDCRPRGSTEVSVLRRRECAVVRARCWWQRIGRAGGIGRRVVDEQIAAIAIRHEVLHLVPTTSSEGNAACAADSVHICTIWTLQNKK